MRGAPAAPGTTVRVRSNEREDQRARRGSLATPGTLRE